jgi:hypothetical protein
VEIELPSEDELRPQYSLLQNLVTLEVDDAVGLVPECRIMGRQESSSAPFSGQALKQLDYLLNPPGSGSRLVKSDIRRKTESIGFGLHLDSKRPVIPFKHNTSAALKRLEFAVQVRSAISLPSTLDPGHQAALPMVWGRQVR